MVKINLATLIATVGLTAGTIASAQDRAPGIYAAVFSDQNGSFIACDNYGGNKSQGKFELIGEGDSPLDYECWSSGKMSQSDNYLSSSGVTTIEVVRVEDTEVTTGDPLEAGNTSPQTISVTYNYTDNSTTNITYNIPSGNPNTSSESQISLPLLRASAVEVTLPTQQIECEGGLISLRMSNSEEKYDLCDTDSKNALLTKIEGNGCSIIRKEEENVRKSYTSEDLGGIEQYLNGNNWNDYSSHELICSPKNAFGGTLPQPRSANSNLTHTIGVREYLIGKNAKCDSVGGTLQADNSKPQFNNCVFQTTPDGLEAKLTTLGITDETDNIKYGIAGTSTDAVDSWANDFSIKGITGALNDQTTPSFVEIVTVKNSTTAPTTTTQTPTSTSLCGGVTSEIYFANESLGSFPLCDANTRSGVISTLEEQGCEHGYSSKNSGNIYTRIQGELDPFLEQKQNKPAIYLNCAPKISTNGGSSSNGGSEETSRGGDSTDNGGRNT